MDDSSLDLSPAEPASPAGDDVSAIAWVLEELRRSLDAAHKSLRRFLKDIEAVNGSDIGAVDPGVLRTARAQIHQGVGALELVGLPAAATVLRASEAAVQRSIGRPQSLTPELVGDIEHASFGLLDFLGRVLAGKKISPLALFPQYRAVQEAVGAERIHPADLWQLDWRWREIASDPQSEPRAADIKTGAQVENHLLSILRGTQALTAAAKMSELSAGLSAGATDPQVRTFWKLAAAFFEAQHHGLLPFDVFTKRVASRLLAQYRILQRGDSDVSERLARDLLFFCAQAAPPGRGVRVPRLAAVRAAYGLADEAPTDYAVSALGRFDPAVVAHAKKRVVAAKEAWSASAGGELHRLASLSEQFSLVGDSLRKLFPFGESFAAELQAAVGQTQQSQAAPPPPLAMEVATSLLYVEAELEDGDFDNPAHADRVRRLGERLAGVRAGRAPAPLEPWMEELYRRVSDRQTMGSVVQELRASLGEVEKAIDKFFRDPKERGVLVDVPVQFNAMRGVLSVLGMDAAAQALVHMRDEVDALMTTEHDAVRVGRPGVFDHIAGNLSALGFMIDMLSVQPQLAKSLFKYDPGSGTLEPVMGRSASPKAALGTPVEPQLVEQAQLLAFTAVRDDVPLQDVTRDLERLSHEAQAADQPALAAAVLKAQEAIDRAQDASSLASARGELSEALVDFVASTTEPVGLMPVSQPAPLDSIRPIALVADLEHDDEMRDVFLEEAREVIDSAGEACLGLLAAPAELSLLTTVRRAFHTLKGSARMVGLRAFGEAAWAGEQVYNTQLAEQRPAEAALIEFTQWLLDHLRHWVDDITAKRDGDRSEGEVKVAVDRLTRRLSSSETSDIELPLGLPADLPSRADLELGGAAAAPAALNEVAEAGIPEDVSFELDLSSFEAGAGGARTAPAPLAAEGANPAAMFDPFDTADAMQTTLTNEQFDRANAEGPVDLDLGQTSEHPPLIHSLSPSNAGEEVVATALPEAHGEGEELALADSDDELVKLVGPLRIGIPLFNIYLNEADELSRRLMTEVSEWAMELHRPIGEVAIALAHSLAGSSSTVGFADLSHLARSLEHALARSQVIGTGTPDEASIFVAAAEEIRRLLHQFAAGFLHQPAPELLARLAEHEISSAIRLEAATAAYEMDDGEDLAQAESGAEPLMTLDLGDGIDTQFGDDEVEADGAASAPMPELHLLGDDHVEPFAEDAPPAAATPHSEAAPAVAATAEAAAPAAAEPEPELVLEAEPAQEAEAEAEPLTLRMPAAEATPAVPPEPEPEPFSEPEPSFDAPASAFGPLGPANALGLAELKTLEPVSLDLTRAPARPTAFGDIDDDIDAIDAVDLELFPIFEEEAHDLLPRLAGQLRDWQRAPATTAHAAACMRTLHTLKGGARLAGAMRLGEMAHRLETRIERLTGVDATATAEDVETLQGRADNMTGAFEALRTRDAQAYADAVAAATAPVQHAEPVHHAEPVARAEEAPVATNGDAASDSGAAAAGEGLHVGAEPQTAAPQSPTGTDQVVDGTTSPFQPAAALAPIDWAHFANAPKAAIKPAERAQAAQSAVRVRAPLLDRLVNQAGEVSITRSRIESGVGLIKGSLGDLTENLERLRGQLRDIELQGEVQMSSRLEAAKAASQAFDPLEFDRFTRFQELTRMMAESVNDVATVQRTLQRSVETTEDELVAQARLTRDLQDDLLRTRMIEFEGLSDRLYRVVRLTAKETGKQVRLDIVGGSIEVDRGVLDRMTGAFEHVLRNAITHGIETPEARVAAGKEAAGSIVVSISQEGNEVGVEFRDDGGGLDLERIRAKGVAMGLLDPDATHEDTELANLIFTAGFSTATTVTEIAGRGVGMDVVRSEVIAMGGRIETATSAGQGTSFRLVLPLTTAVTQVVMLRSGGSTIAVPSTLVELVRRATPPEIDAAYASGTYEFGERTLAFFWLGALLQQGTRPAASDSRTRTVVVVRSAQQRIAIHVDEVLGNQEVVVKNLGPQLSRLPGLAGMTLLASGAVTLIYNPVALATLYGDEARAATARAMAPSAAVPVREQAATVPLAPLVLVVDDSLTVRRVTQRMLVREGYRVTLAKDGLDALERLAGEIPQVVLSDIEMPRMDGFDLVRNIRADARWRDLPVIMITSRIAQKHREHAAELGVDHYLGKPYSEEDLLALVGRYTAAPANA